MPKENRSQTVIPADVIASITEHLKNIQTALAPYVTPLEEEERKSMSKMSDKTVAFVTKSHDYTESNPEFMPAFIPMPEFDIDFANVASVNPLAKLALTVANNLNDTAMVAGSEAFFAARAYYNNVKLGEKSNAPGARTIYAELKKRYPGRSRGDENNGATTVAP